MGGDIQFRLMKGVGYLKTTCVYEIETSWRYRFYILGCPWKPSDNTLNHNVVKSWKPSGRLIFVGADAEFLCIEFFMCWCLRALCFMFIFCQFLEKDRGSTHYCWLPIA